MAKRTCPQKYVLKAINSLQNNKCLLSYNIPHKKLSDPFLSCIAGFTNYSKVIPSYPDELRSTGVMSVYKKYRHFN